MKFTTFDGAEFSDLAAAQTHEENLKQAQIQSRATEATKALADVIYTGGGVKKSDATAAAQQYAGWFFRPGFALAVANVLLTFEGQPVCVPVAESSVNPVAAPPVKKRGRKPATQAVTLSEVESAASVPLAAPAAAASGAPAKKRGRPPKNAAAPAAAPAAPSAPVAPPVPPVAAPAPVAALAPTGKRGRPAKNPPAAAPAASAASDAPAKKRGRPPKNAASPAVAPAAPSAPPVAAPVAVPAAIAAPAAAGLPSVPVAVSGGINYTAPPQATGAPAAGGTIPGVPSFFQPPPQ